MSWAPILESAMSGMDARSAARQASGALALLASPTFALMSLVTTIHAGPVALCSPNPSFLPVDAMSAMYLLMSLFHLGPWLRLAGHVAQSKGT